MVADQEARTELRNALGSYMKGEIRTHQFADCNLQFRNPKSTSDVTVHKISQFLYLYHDDIVDHTISVSPEAWSALRRIVAYLHTDLTNETTDLHPAWPFHNEEQWQQHEPILDEIDLPEYDPEIHNRPANRWWNRIPSSVGFAILGGLLLIVLIFLFTS